MNSAKKLSNFKGILLIFLISSFSGCSHSIPKVEKWPERPYSFLYNSNGKAGYFMAGISSQKGKTEDIKSLREDFKLFKPTTVFIEEPGNLNHEEYIEGSLKKGDFLKSEKDWLVKWATDDGLKIEFMAESYLEAAKRQLNTKKVKDPIMHFVAMHTYLTLYARRNRIDKQQYDSELRAIVKFAFNDSNLSFISKIGKLDSLKNYIAKKYPSTDYYEGLIKLLDDYAKVRGYPFFTQWLDAEGGFERQHKFVAPYPYGSEPSNILARIYYDATDQRVLKLLNQYSAKRIFGIIGKSHFKTIKQRLEEKGLN